MTPAPSFPAKKTFVQSLIKGYGLPVLCILGSIILLLISVRPALTKIQVLRDEQAEIKKLLSTLYRDSSKHKEMIDNMVRQIEVISRNEY